jgi:GxxExxY protein
MNENGIGTIVVDSAVELHRDLGPGLLETVYEVTLARALERRGLRVQRQVAVAIEYRGERFGTGSRMHKCIFGFRAPGVKPCKCQS